ncbi:DNA polymerase, partial [Allobaculum mucilyticum]
MPDLKEARSLVADKNIQALEMLYDDIPDTLSQLIRTALVAPDGKDFIVADFSAIEARVLSWLAEEEWRQAVFKENGDIYCETASRMFKVPVVKHGVNGDLRQKGKQAELACGYGGSVGAMKAMGALDFGMKEEELKPLVDSWREAN